MKRFLFILIISFTYSQWSSDPASPQEVGIGIQAQLKSTSDGGVYIAWLTDMGGYHVYLQRYDSEGVAQFESGGMLVSNQPNSSWIAVHHMNLAVDSNDNAIISTLDTRTGIWQVYVYKITPDGTMTWGTDGIALSIPGTDNLSPRLTILSDNSTIVAWCQNYITVRLQRISENGALQWGDGGIHIVDSSGDLVNPLPITVDESNILLQWNHQSGPFWSPNSKLYQQKYNISGNGLWDSPIVVVGPVVFPMGNFFQESVGNYVGGSFSGWTEISGAVQSSVVQHINSNGDLSWIGGVELSTNGNVFRLIPQLTIAEDSQNLMAVWYQSNASQSQRGVFAQRLDENGNRLWGDYGTSVVALNSNVYYDLSIVGFGEDMVTSYIQTNSSNSISDIYAIRMNVDGNSVWNDGDIAVTNSNSPKTDMNVDKGQGCIFIAWTENGNVYAHCLKEDGTLGTPETSILGDVNGDGLINVLDIVFILDWILEGSEPTEEQLSTGDLNSDGIINVIDIVLIVEAILGN